MKVLFHYQLIQESIMNNSFPPLSFVTLKGFGKNPLIVQVSMDKNFLILSTNYLLTPILNVPELIEDYIGTQADIISKNASVYKKLLEVIYKLNTEQEEIKCNIDDPILVIRAFINLSKIRDISDQNIEIDYSEYLESIKNAITQDELIKNIHHNFLNAIKKQ